MGLVRAEPGSLTEVRRALGSLEAGGSGGIGGKELRGAEDEAEEGTEGKEGTLCAFQALGQAERDRRK